MLPSYENLCESIPDRIGFVEGQFLLLETKKQQKKNDHDDGKPEAPLNAKKQKKTKG